VVVFSALWNALHHVLVSITDARVTVVRYEDMCVEPGTRFPALFDHLDLPYSNGSASFIRASTDGTAGGERAPHVWNLSLRSLPSRTAFRPMDSKHHLDSWKKHVGPAEAMRVQEATWDVGSRVYDEQAWNLVT
jgi:hypothetical protein